MFGCRDLVNRLVNLGVNELHGDGTFKIVPLVPSCRQLFILHVIYQNHVRKYYTQILFLTIDLFFIFNNYF